MVFMTAPTKAMNCSTDIGGQPLTMDFHFTVSLRIRIVQRYLQTTRHKLGHPTI